MVGGASCGHSYQQLDKEKGGQREAESSVEILSSVTLAAQHLLLYLYEDSVVHVVLASTAQYTHRRRGKHDR